MRHRVASKQFGRRTNQRRALLRELVAALVEHGQITTTQAKAKEARRQLDKLINQAQTNTLASRRQLHSYFGKRNLANTLVDKIAPLFPKRQSGFTRIQYVGSRRGDNADVYQVTLVNKPESMGSLTKTKKVEKPKSVDKPKPAKKSSKKASE